MYPCLQCGQAKCEHKESMCKQCAENTVRTIRISDRDILAGDTTIRDQLMAGESVESSYHDQETREQVYIVKRFLN